MAHRHGWGPLRIAAVRPGRRAALGLAMLAALAELAAPPAARAQPTTAATAAATAVELADLPLEQLREIVVTTVSRHEERLDRVAASVFVIGAEDIRRSGATTLPEALRLSPLLQVARADANQYAVTARGFNNVLANKMLVLIDGRTVYTPLFSGVFWEAQDVMLEDVERIEVVAGPSTALWGSNAVNGLIHVVTRSAARTQGPLAVVEAGNHERSAALRHGVALGEDGHLRLWAKGFDRDATHRADGSSVDDQADGHRVGLRADWSRGRTALTLSGDAYRAVIDQPAPAARRIRGAHLLGRLEHDLGGGRHASAQVVVERTERVHPQVFAETLDVVDATAQYRWRTGRHDVVLGGGWRLARDDVRNPGPLAFLPGRKSLRWGRLFAQDRIALDPRLTLSLAASAEHNPYTGTEWLPSARLAWQAAPGHVVWGAMSRAVRAPSRIDREFFQPATPPFAIAGGPDFRSEVANVVEVGWRGQATERLSTAVTAYHHEFRRLRSLAPTAAGAQVRNDWRGHARGASAWLRWRPRDDLSLVAGATVLRTRLTLAPGAVDLAGVAALGNDPRHAWQARVSWDPSPQWTWDVALRRVGALPAPAVPAYTAVDSRLAWRASRHVELALVAHNLFDPGHAEWGAPANRVEHERALGLQLRWQP